MPVGTPFHERTLALCESLNYREWSGYYTVSAYETHHDHEYNAIRNAAALIDISPLFKYRVSGKDASRLVDRVITRDGGSPAVQIGPEARDGAVVDPLPRPVAPVRRRGKGDRRRHRLAPRARSVPLDCRRA